jgi:hypothetical protein
MENPFSTNAFYLLGLPVTASQSDIKRKARLLSAQIGIGEDKLDSDFQHLKPIRNEDTIREAQQRLSNPIKRIQESFFWFSQEDEEELEKLIRDGYLEDAQIYLSKKASVQGKWNAKRDSAIFLTQLLYSKRSFKKYLTESLETWKEVLASESAWKYFQLAYKNTDDLDTDESAFEGLNKWAANEISEIYSGLSEKWDDKDFSHEYTRVFGKASSVAQKNVLAPNARRINEASDRLNGIKWADKNPSKENINQIKVSIAEIQDALNEIAENGLYEDDQSLALRDKASDAIRSVAVDLNNKFNDYERSAKILLIAEEISGTESTKTRNKGERGTIEDNLSAQKFRVPVMELQNKGKFRQAVELVEQQLEKYGSDPAVKKTLEQQLRNAKKRYVVEQRSASMAKFNSKDFSAASGIFSNLRIYIMNNLDDLEVEEKMVTGILEPIDAETKLVDKNNITKIGNDRDELVKVLFERMGETDSAYVLMCAIDCAFYHPICEYLRMASSKNATISVLYRIGGWTLLLYGIGLIFLIPAFIWNLFEVKYVRE